MHVGYGIIKLWKGCIINKYLKKMGVASQRNLGEIIKSKYSYVQAKSQFGRQISGWRFSDLEL